MSFLGHPRPHKGPRHLHLSPPWTTNHLSGLHGENSDGSEVYWTAQMILITSQELKEADDINNPVTSATTRSSQMKHNWCSLHVASGESPYPEALVSSATGSGKGGGSENATPQPCEEWDPMGRRGGTRV